MILSHQGSQYADIQLTEGAGLYPTESALNQAFKNSASSLFNRKSEIHKHNERVFTKDKNVKLFNEVGDFADRGFDHSGEGIREIKSKYKSGKIRKNIDKELPF